MKIVTPKKNVDRQEVKDATSKGLGKGWTIKSGEGDKITFYPFFTKTEDGEVECVGTKIKIPTDIGDKTISLHYENLFQFIYAISNEEHRTKMEMIKTREVRMIPYDVTIRIRPEEKDKQLIKRRVELKVSELVAAYCQQEAVKWMIKKQKK